MKALTAQKEELLRESKEKQVTYDNVKSQVDKLMKVRSCLIQSTTLVDLELLQMAAEVKKTVDDLVLPIPPSSPPPASSPTPS
jgi:THO complex subunit 5